MYSLMVETIYFSFLCSFMQTVVKLVHEKADSTEQFIGAEP